MKKPVLIAILVLLGNFSACNVEKKTENAVLENKRVFNLENEAVVEEFMAMNLDSTYTNLLDPRNTSGEERAEVLRSWSEFHQKISQYLAEENFDWEVEDERIKIGNRIYFDKDGTVKYYFFRFQNENISGEKKEEFQKILARFAADNRIRYTKEKGFAQCGSIEIVNEKG